jgi:hypothetical protein
VAKYINTYQEVAFIIGKEPVGTEIANYVQNFPEARQLGIARDLW